LFFQQNATLFGLAEGKSFLGAAYVWQAFQFFHRNEKSERRPHRDDVRIFHLCLICARKTL